MAKKIWQGAALLNPVPIVMVSIGDAPENYNIITIAWTGIICSEPAMTYVSIRPQRLSHDILSRTKEFVINIPNQKLAKAVDFCGVRSGRKFNKFKELKLTADPSREIKAPLIRECPINLECRVTEIKKLGTHDMFLANILAVHVERKLINNKNNLIYENADPICYCHGYYYALGKNLGRQGFSVMKGVQ